MKLEGHAKLLRVFIGEIDKIGHTPLYEAIVQEARNQGIAGATVLRGIMSYGASSRIHTAKLIDISEDLPIVIEIVDEEKKINDFLPVINGLFDKCGRGGMMTIEQVNVLYYEPKNKKP
jgi:PII-like signaling protein